MTETALLKDTKRLGSVEGKNPAVRFGTLNATGQTVPRAPVCAPKKSPLSTPESPFSVPQSASATHLWATEHSFLVLLQSSPLLTLR